MKRRAIPSVTGGVTVGGAKSDSVRCAMRPGGRLGFGATCGRSVRTALSHARTGAAQLHQPDSNPSIVLLFALRLICNSFAGRKLDLAAAAGSSCSRCCAEFSSSPCRRRAVLASPSALHSAGRREEIGEFLLQYSGAAVLWSVLRLAFCIRVRVQEDRIVVAGCCAFLVNTTHEVRLRSRGKMDYGRLNRRELQSLCKEHGIPANKTNVFMAEALNALLNAPKDKAMDSGPDPAEVVKGRATRSRQAVSPAEDVVSPTELDDLSIHLAQNTLNESCGSDSTTADEEDSWKEVQLEARLPLGKSVAEMEEPVKVYQSRRARKAVDVEVRSKAKHEIVRLMEVTQAAPSPVAAPALVNDDVQPAVDTCPNVVDSIVESNGPTTKVAAKKTKSKGKRSAKAKAQEVPDIPVEAISPPIDGDLKNVDQDAAILSSEEKSEVDPPVPSAPAVVAKKSKANGTRSKKTRSAAAPAPTLKHEATHGAEEQSKGPFKVSDSPAYGLTVEGNCDLAQEKLAADFSTQVRGSRSSSPVDEFEFQPVPASFEEIMSSDLPQGTPVPAPGCCHRVGKKPGMGGCPSCASERKVAELMQGMLNSMDEKSALTEEKEPAHASAKNYANTTPTKPHDDKENVLKSEDVEAIPLEKMSMRKLQKKLQKKGLSKRNNMAAPAIV